MSLTAKILTGMVVGLLTGLLFQWLSLPPENFLQVYLVDEPIRRGWADIYSFLEDAGGSVGVCLTYLWCSKLRRDR